MRDVVVQEFHPRSLLCRGQSWLVRAGSAVLVPLGQYRPIAALLSMFCIIKPRTKDLYLARQTPMKRERMQAMRTAAMTRISWRSSSLTDNISL